MKIVLISVGTRGDMEPFLAIGELLQEKGHDVLCAFPEHFRDLAEDAGLAFASLGTRFIELLESDLGKLAMGGDISGLKKVWTYIRLAKQSKEANQEILFKQYELVERECPDRILHHSKAVYPMIWGLENRGKTMLVTPVPYLHYVKDQAHLIFNNNYGKFLNKLTYALADFGLVTTVMVSMKWLKLKRRFTRKQVRQSLRSNKVTYTISPSLFPEPDYWGENLKILGYHARDQKSNWQPDKELVDFLARHDKILFVTFGSMINPEPEEKTRIIVEILQRNRIPAVINTALGGLVKTDAYDPELIQFTSHIPYDWIFPKVYGVMHHGGSGTTHMALKYGCASLIIPHIIDQFVWNKIISKLGAGPLGIKIGKLTVRNLEPKICALMKDFSYKQHAMKIAEQMEKEDFEEALYQSIVKE